MMMSSGGNLIWSCRVYAQPGVRLVLVGDTGERDPEIYAAFSSAHPGRVARVFLRRATADPVPPERWIGAYLFTDPAKAAREAVARGLADGKCVDAAFQVKTEE